MATKVTGIKGINISKASVLNDGTKKTSGNESFRDTSNGTTRDNSGNSALDAASLKLLLGQTELLAKKAQEIEQNMKIAQQKEEDRQKQIEQRRKDREKKEYEKEQNDKKRKDREDKSTFDSYYNNINKGLINGGLASMFGPAAVLLGKGLNHLGLPLERMGKWALRKSTKIKWTPLPCKAKVKLKYWTTPLICPTLWKRWARWVIPLRSRAAH